MRLPRQAAFGPPLLLAGMLVQRDDEGPVPGGAEADVDRICRAVAVERHDQLVPVKDRRDRQPMFTNELLVLPIPGDVPLEINRHDPAAVESGVHQIPVRHRRRGRMRVLGQLAGRGLMEQLLVPDDLATGSIKAKQAAGCPVRRRRGHNDAIFPDTGRRPCDPRDLGTPRQILVEAPGQRQVLLMRDTLASWPSEARPVLGETGTGGSAGGAQCPEEAAQIEDSGHHSLPFHHRPNPPTWIAPEANVYSTPRGGVPVILIEERALDQPV